MPIKVACKCGQSFNANDNLAGRTVKCPKCSSPLAVPGGTAGGKPQRPATAAAPKQPVGGLGDLLDEAGITAYAGPRCPACQEPLKPNMPLCVKCGFNLQTGQKVAGAVAGRSGDGHGAGADEMLHRAATEIDKAPPPQAESAAGMLVSYLFAFGLLALVGAALTGAYFGFTTIEKSGRSQYYAGWTMAVVGTLMFTAAHITMIVLAFKDSLLHGFLSIFVPFYNPIYGLLRGHSFWAFLWFMGSLFSNVGGFMAFYMKDARDVERVTWLFLTNLGLVA